MSGRHSKKKKKHQVQQAAVCVENQPAAETLCQKHPDTNNEDIMAYSEPFPKPPDSKVAVWTLFTAIIVAAIYLLQLIAMRDTVQDLEKQTRLSVRPWVGLDEGLDAIQNSQLVIYKDGNASLIYTVRVKNYSGSPASNVWSAANLVVADDTSTLYEQQGFACGDAMIGKPDIGLVLFQGKDREFQSTPATTKIALKHQGAQIRVWLTGCVGYRDQFGYLCRTKFTWGMRDNVRGFIVFQEPVQPGTIAGHFEPESTAGAIDTCQVPKYK